MSIFQILFNNEMKKSERKDFCRILKTLKITTLTVILLFFVNFCISIWYSDDIQKWNHLNNSKLCRVRILNKISIFYIILFGQFLNFENEKTNQL